MKILAGQWRGHGLSQPKSSAVRPLSEKVRAALFDVVGDPAGWNVLDAYAGSGAAGLEALSRGAAMVEAIEGNRSVAAVINANATALKADWGFVVSNMTVETWLARKDQQPQSPRFDLIMADPPYQQLDRDVLDRLAAHLTPDGVMVVSHSSRLASPMLKSAELAGHKVYGDSALSFYRAT